MLLEEIATRLNTTSDDLERESLRYHLQHHLRVVEGELFGLARRYGVNTVFELDQAVRAGRFRESDAFEDYFRFDYLEGDRDTLRELLAQP